MVLGLLLLGISDTSASIADTNVPDNEIPSNVREADDSDSATATITITMYTLPDE